MNKNKKISRRKMFKQLGIYTAAPISFLWYFGTKRKMETTRFARVVIPKNLPYGISFLNGTIIYKMENNIKVFSSNCTHLGCKIKNVENDQLVCPCHGSKFDFDGAPQNGPATKKLNQLEIKKDRSTGELIVYV